MGNGYVSREAYEQTATEAAALRATVQADKAAVESAALDLSYCTLRAPSAAAWAGLKGRQGGNMVRSSDTTPIVSIDTLSPIYVTFSVPERHLSLILDRMHAGPVEVDVTPTGGQAEKGLLTLVENSVDTTTGTIQLRATFANENRRLWPGQFVTVELPLGMARQAWPSPAGRCRAGVRNITSMWPVLTARPPTARWTSFSRPVTPAWWKARSRPGKGSSSTASCVWPPMCRWRCCPRDVRLHRPQGRHASHVPDRRTAGAAVGAAGKGFLKGTAQGLGRDGCAPGRPGHRPRR